MSLMGYEIDDQAAAEIFGHNINNLKRSACHGALKYGKKKLGVAIHKITKKFKWNEEQ